jgi:hypothetical protein
MMINNSSSSLAIAISISGYFLIISDIDLTFLKPVLLETRVRRSRFAAYHRTVPVLSEAHVAARIRIDPLEPRHDRKILSDFGK